MKNLHIYMTSKQEWFFQVDEEEYNEFINLWKDIKTGRGTNTLFSFRRGEWTTYLDLIEVEAVAVESNVGSPESRLTKNLAV